MTMDNSQDFQTLQEHIRPCLITTCSTAKKISDEDLAFQRSLNPAVGTALEEQSRRLLSLASALIKSAASISELRTPTLDDVEDVDNNWRNLVDVVDSLLEKSDTCLDEYTGLIKRKDTSETATKNEPYSKHKKPGSTLAHNLRTQNLVKPQLSFEKKPNNQDNTPWKPFLTAKPHAAVPLEESLVLFTNDFNQKQYRHPYEPEISTVKYPDFLYQKAEPIPYQPVENTSAVFVDTQEAVMQMLEELRNAKEIAVDLEHHEARSYHGLLSLMQISTRDKDWIIDTLKPWRQNLQVLNEVFANPNIVKVFHGASLDIIWLQRDLGLYIVGLFDTHKACQTLGYPGGSLAFLLKKFINFDADKVYQLADWRIRPLPVEMLFYARADTHYLLYIYDHLRNELIDRSELENPEKNLIEIVLQKSKEMSLSRYERQVYNFESGKGPGGWYSLLLKSPVLLSNEQFAVFRAVHAWRDQTARLDDDSPTYLMPQHVLFNIAKHLPTDLLALLRVAHPISHSVKSRANELLDVINSARNSEHSGLIMPEINRSKSFASSKTKDPSIVTKESPKVSAAAVDQKDLESLSSSFWGPAFGSSMWESQNRTSVEDLRKTFQLPIVPSNIRDTNLESPQTTPRNVSSFSTELTSQELKEKPPFVLKPGSTHKNEQILPDNENSIDNTDHQVSENVSKCILSNKEENARKHTIEHSTYQQNFKKPANSSSEIANSGKVEDDKHNFGDEADYKKPFDYSKAESVLHSKIKQGQREDSRQKKPFDPYSKSADSTKGIRRSQTERIGKSQTFRR